MNHSTTVATVNKEFSIQSGAEKISVLSLRDGEWFVPINYGEAFFQPFKLLEKHSLHVVAEDVSGKRKIFQHIDKCVRARVAGFDGIQIRIEDFSVFEFGKTWGFSKSGNCHAYLSPMEIIFQYSDDGAFVEFDGDELEARRANWATEDGLKLSRKLDEHLESLPTWKGDLADVVSFFFRIGQVYDFTDKVEGGLVWLNEEIQPETFPDEFPKTERNHYQLNFRQFFEEYLTEDDLKLFVIRDVIPLGLHLK